VLLGVLALVAGPYAYKTLHRASVLGQEQQRNRAERQRLWPLMQPANCPRLLVSDAVETTFKSESPFSDEPTPHLMPVAGWITLHPSQAAWRQQLTGTRHFPESLRRLATRYDVAWVLTPSTAAILNRQLARLAGPRVRLVLIPPDVLERAGGKIQRPHPQTDAAQAYKPVVDSVD
jgi:hypothetical protein